MRTIHKTFITIVLLFTGQLLLAQEFQLQTAKSSLKWTGKAAFNNYSLTGTIQPEKGVLVLQKDSLIDLQLSIDMKSLDHKNSNLKRHLRSKDFFEVNKHTRAIFSLNKSILLEGDTTISGKLTIKDQTHIEEPKIQINRKANDIVITFEMVINRIQYGITYNSPSVFEKLKDQAISDEFVVKGKLIFTRLK